MKWQKIMQDKQQNNCLLLETIRLQLTKNSLMERDVSCLAASLQR